MQLQKPKIEKWHLKYGKDVPSLIRNFRKEKGFSQRDLAKTMRVHLQYISNVERGKYTAPVAFYNRIKKFLDWRRRHVFEIFLNVALVDKVNKRI